MPELPEVETMCRGITPVVGSQIQQFEAVRGPHRPIAIQPRPRTLAAKVSGEAIRAVTRLGKRVVLELSDGGRLIFEPRMTGLVLLASPPDASHLRARITLRGGSARELLFWDRRGLGSVRWMTAAEFARAFSDGRLGPDALALSADELRNRLRGSRRAIKVALLDQRALAGVGNLYASEMLHVAGIHPARPCTAVTVGEWQALHAALRAVLTEAIRYEGSTLSDGTYRNALNQAGGYQAHHRVYDRAGRVCGTCGRGTIERVVQAQRSTFFCVVCQPRTRRRSAGR